MLKCFNNICSSTFLDLKTLARVFAYFKTSDVRTPVGRRM